MGLGSLGSREICGEGKDPGAVAWCGGAEMGVYILVDARPLVVLSSL